jgi:hypothetical protein
MAGNFNQLEKLTLKGHFRASEETKKHWEEGLDIDNLSTEQQKILDFMNQDFEFEVKIFEFDSNSGLFIAKGEDVFGKSVISGKIKYEREIEFKKQYIGEPRHKLPVQRANSVDYSGAANSNSTPADLSNRRQDRHRR